MSFCRSSNGGFKPYASGLRFWHGSDGTIVPARVLFSIWKISLYMTKADKIRDTLCMNSNGQSLHVYICNQIVHAGVLCRELQVYLHAQRWTGLCRLYICGLPAVEVTTPQWLLYYESNRSLLSLTNVLDLYLQHWTRQLRSLLLIYNILNRRMYKWSHAS